VHFSWYVYKSLVLTLKVLVFLGKSHVVFVFLFFADIMKILVFLTFFSVNCTSHFSFAGSNCDGDLHKPPTLHLHKRIPVRVQRKETKIRESLLQISHGVNASRRRARAGKRNTGSSNGNTNSNINTNSSNSDSNSAISMIV